MFLAYSTIPLLLFTQSAIALYRKDSFEPPSVLQPAEGPQRPHFLFKRQANESSISPPKSPTTPTGLPPEASDTPLPQDTPSPPDPHQTPSGEISTKTGGATAPPDSGEPSTMSNVTGKSPKRPYLVLLLLFLFSSFL